MINHVPTIIVSESALDELLTRPTPALVEHAASLRGPLLVLGAGGKMGPSLCVRAARAIAQAGTGAIVVAASRFPQPATRQWLEARGVQTIACDLLEPGALEAVPEAEDVICMVGRKFGTGSEAPATWVTNAVLPGLIASRFRNSRLVMLSTGNVYPLVPVSGTGSRESDALDPVGEYAASCVARERVCQHYAIRNRTRVALVRLNYALDLRYGVFLDIANQVYRGDPVDVRMGFVNCIWQGDANDMIIRSLALAESPARAINITGDQRLSVRELAQAFGHAFGRRALLSGLETDTAYLCDVSLMMASLGAPQTPLDVVIRWTAHWVKAGRRQLGKPTHFSVRDGGF